MEAIRSFPTERVVEHCGKSAVISPFAIYYRCAECDKDVKVRSFAANPELEDVFDAVFEWMTSPEAARVAEERREAIEAENES